MIRDPLHSPEYARVDAVLDAAGSGALVAPLAAMHAVLATADAAALEHALARAEARWGVGALAPLRARLAPEVEARVRAVAAAVDHGPSGGAAPEATLRALATSFDRAALRSPEAASALYALGDPDLLEAATAEVVDWLRSQRLMRSGARVVEVGCGSGRFLRALALEGAVALGVELSPGMAAAAAGRCAQLPVAVALGSGADLAFVADDAADLVLFADSFPYVAQAGGDLPERMLAEAARALAPGGRIVVLNWSYGDRAVAATERARLLARCGLVEADVAAPAWRAWDAEALVFALDSSGASRRARLLMRAARAPVVNGRAVVVCAHPDDETLAVGGRLSAFADLAVVHVTDGAPRDMGDARRAGFDTRESYAAARAGELETALDILAPGLTPERRVRLRVADQEAAAEVRAIADRLAPLLRGAAMVLTHPYEGGHPDHDATALAVALACARLERAGEPAPVRMEFASYHAGPDGAPRFGRFYGEAGGDVAVWLGATALARKRQAAAAHASQADIVANFHLEVERFRLAPSYRFDAPPPPGRALYDGWGWALTSERWRALTAAAAAELHG